MVVVSASTDSLGEILQVRKLTSLRSVGEIRGELAELAGRAGVALRRGRLRGAIQISRYLRRYLGILRWIRLLQLLQRAGQLSEGRKLAAVGL